MNILNQSELTLSPMKHYDFNLRAALAALSDVIQRKNEYKSGKNYEIPSEIDLFQKSITNLLNPILVESVKIYFNILNLFKYILGYDIV